LYFPCHVKKAFLTTLIWVYFVSGLKLAYYRDLLGLFEALNKCFVCWKQKAMDLWNKLVFCTMQHVMLSLLEQRSNLTYQGITNIVASFDSIPIVLVPWDRFSLCHTSQTWFLAFLGIMFFRGCLTTWSKGLHQLVSELGSGIKLYPSCFRYLFVSCQFLFVCLCFVSGEYLFSFLCLFLLFYVCCVLIREKKTIRKRYLG
jgi:hypothetical protein